MNSLVSVIIVNRNGIDFIGACLRSVLNSAYPDFEIIFIDNASTDGSLQYVKKAFGEEKKLHFIENSESLGPAVGRNRGIAIAKGKYVVFLDNDTEVDRFWLTELIKPFEEDPSIGSAQSKLLKLNQRDMYDCAGDYLTPFGFLSERARAARDTGQFDKIADILSAKSAASIIRKDLLDKIGGFDESYYMYLEETDLSWRVWLAGYRVIFIPKSVVYHAYGTKKKPTTEYYSEYVIRYYGCRNYISTLIKNLEINNLYKIIPFHIFSWLGLSLIFLLKLKPKDAFWILKGVFWNLTNFVQVIKKRNFVQTNIRKVSDRAILNKIMVSKPLIFYFGKAFSYVYGKAY